MFHHGFKRGERLKRRKLIDRLFREGKGFTEYPLRVVWLPQPLDTCYPTQVTFSVSRKKFRRATQRNLLKRRMREAWRVSKSTLYRYLLDGHAQCAIMFIYIGKEEHKFDFIASKITRSLHRLRKSLRPFVKR